MEGFKQLFLYIYLYFIVAVDMSVTKKFTLTVKIKNKVEVIWSSKVKTGRVLFRPMAEYGFD